MRLLSGRGFRKRRQACRNSGIVGVKRVGGARRLSPNLWKSSRFTNGLERSRLSTARCTAVFKSHSDPRVGKLQPLSETPPHTATGRLRLREVVGVAG